MKAIVHQDKWMTLTSLSLTLFVFFLVISPTVKSIFLISSLLLILLTPYYRPYLWYAFNTLWGRAILIFFAFVLLACCWSQAPHSTQWMVVGKYLKVMYLPILAVGFLQPKARSWGMHSYLAAISLTCILCIIKSRGYLSSLALDPDPGALFYNHIITGFMVAVAAYLSGLLAFQSKGWLRFFYLALLLLSSYQVLCINTGRTGYVVYCLLMTFLLFQCFSFIKALFGIFLLSSLMLLVYQKNPTMHAGINELVQNISALQQNDQNTSLGYRMQFHAYAKTLFASHSAIGIGTGGFQYHSLKDNPFPSWGGKFIEPHSQYWMTLSEQGLIGLLFLFCFFAALFICSFQLRETKPLLLGILASFAIGAFSDTILCYSALGFLLVVMSALSFGELIEKRTQP